jgi:hypothetical protein
MADINRQIAGVNANLTKIEKRIFHLKEFELGGNKYGREKMSLLVEKHRIGMIKLNRLQDVARHERDAKHQDFIKKLRG